MPTIGATEFTFENVMVDSRMCRNPMAATQNHRGYGITLLDYREQTRKSLQHLFYSRDGGL